MYDILKLKFSRMQDIQNESKVIRQLEPSESEKKSKRTTKKFAITNFTKKSILVHIEKEVSEEETELTVFKDQWLKPEEWLKLGPPTLLVSRDSENGKPNQLGPHRLPRESPNLSTEILPVDYEYEVDLEKDLDAYFLTSSIFTICFIMALLYSGYRRHKHPLYYLNVKLIGNICCDFFIYVKDFNKVRKSKISESTVQKQISIDVDNQNIFDDLQKKVRQKIILNTVHVM
jgi:hypothetical protein